MVLELNRPNVPRTEQLLPIVVHHATNHPYSTEWSVQSQTYSAPLYQVDDTARSNRTMVTVAQAIAAGDLNIDHNDRTPIEYGVYAYFTDDFAAGGPGNGGANLPYTWVNSATLARNLSAVRLEYQNNQPITSGNVDDYRWLAIDNLFTRNLQTAPLANWGPVYNLLAGLETGGFLVDRQAKRAVIRSFRAAIMTELGAAQGGGTYANYPAAQSREQYPVQDAQGGARRHLQVPGAGHRQPARLQRLSGRPGPWPLHLGAPRRGVLPELGQRPPAGRLPLQGLTASEEGGLAWP